MMTMAICFNANLQLTTTQLQLKLCVVLYVLLNMGEWMEDVDDYMEWRGLVINDDLFISLAHCIAPHKFSSEKPSILNNTG